MPNEVLRTKHYPRFSGSLRRGRPQVHNALGGDIPIEFHWPTKQPPLKEETMFAQLVRAITRRVFAVWMIAQDEWMGLGGEPIEVDPEDVPQDVLDIERSLKARASGRSKINFRQVASAIYQQRISQQARDEKSAPKPNGEETI